MKPRPILNAFHDEPSGNVVLIRREGDIVKEERVRGEWSTWHKRADVPDELYRKLKSHEHIRRVHTEGEWLLVCWSNDHVRRKGRLYLKDKGIKSYEGDVDPVRFWMTETRCEIQKPRRCYLDIETDSRRPFSEKEEMRILSWAIEDDAGNQASGLLEEDADEAEKDLLTLLWDALKEYDQVLAWFGDGFDFPVIFARTEQRNLKIDPRRWVWADMLTIWKRMHSAETGDEKESMRLEDIAQAILGEGKEVVPDFVRERFGDKSLGALAWQLWETGGEFRDLLFRYNVKDTALLRKLEAKKGYLGLFQTNCETCFVFGDSRGLNPTRQMDGSMLRLGRERNYRFATRERIEESEPFKGAFVLEAKSLDPEWRASRGMKNGILRNVHVCDFKSLYPSIVITFNLGEDTKIGKCKRAEDRPNPESTCWSPGTGVVTTLTKKGILPEAMQGLLDLREKWAVIAATLPPGTPEWIDAMAKSTSGKVTVNAFYGGAATPFSRFFELDCAESTTQNGEWLLKLTASHAERRRMDPVFGDTDSLFVSGPTKEAFGKFVQWCNAVLFPREIAAQGCKENRIHLTFEKTFDRIVFTSKKRYIGRYASYKGVAAKADSKPEIKGLEYRRGDTSMLARQLQGKVIDLLVGGLKLNPDVEVPTEDPDQYRRVVEDAREFVLSGELPVGLVRLSKSLSKSVEAYVRQKCPNCGALAPIRGECPKCYVEQPKLTKKREKEIAETANLQPHVQVARELRRRGQHIGEGTKIEYVVVDGSISPMRVIPADDYVGDCDRFYLWENLVYPPTERLLSAAFPDMTSDWEAYGTVRPKKPRTRASKVPPGQLGMFAGQAAPEELAVAAYSAAPLVVEIPEDGGEAMQKRVRAVLDAFPGARQVDVVIRLKTGARAVLGVSPRVSAGPRFAAALAEALDSPAS